MEDHTWMTHDRIFDGKTEFCRKCGVVKRADGQNRACPGKVRVGPR